MPVATKIWGLSGDRHIMSHARWDLLMTAGADIGLESLVGLDPAYFNWTVKTIPDAEHGLLVGFFRGLLGTCHKSTEERPHDEG